MQYNLVVTTNEGAVRLWKKLGFEIIGTLTEAFCVQLVNAVLLEISESWKTG
jgi:ribosomal protein S18 acetylase RimI-like enzyme